jgi:maleate cis-trans isomerase
MNVLPNVNTDTAALIPPRARVGLIIPSVNTFSEPQFNHFAPEGLGIHVARARVAGEWKRPLPERKNGIADAAKLLSDARPDVIVFHCTDTSMTQGPQGEGKILDIVTEATGIGAMATSRLVLEALQTLGMKKVVLLTPYKSIGVVVPSKDRRGPDYFTKFVQSEIKRWSGPIQASGVKIQ